MWRTDMYIEPVAKFPAGLGYEAAGFVDSVGRDVSGVALGDEVNVIPSFSMNQYHTYGEVILVPEQAGAGEHVVMVDDPASTYPYTDDGKIAVPADADSLDPMICLSFIAAPR